MVVLLGWPEVRILGISESNLAWEIARVYGFSQQSPCGGSNQPVGIPAMAQIYFVQAGVGGPVKIGLTQGTIRARMTGLQTGCPWKLILIGAREGTYDDERAVHAHLAAFRISGEWFLAVPEVLGFAENMVAGQEPWPGPVLPKFVPFVRKDFGQPTGLEPVEPVLRNNLLLLALAYSKHKNLRLSTVSSNIHGDPNFFTDLATVAAQYREAGGVRTHNKFSFTFRKYDAVVIKFATQWPPDLEWPELAMDARSPTNGSIEARNVQGRRSGPVHRRTRQR